MAKETSNLIYIIGLLYSLIIIGIVMYIISKASEETVRCNYLKDKSVNRTTFEQDDTNGINEDIFIDKKIEPAMNKELTEILIDGNPVKFVFKDSEEDKWKPHDDDTLIQQDGEMDISYKIDNTEYQTRLICNSGTFENLSSKYKIDNNDRLILKQADGKRVLSPQSLEDGQISFSDVVLDQVPSSTGEGFILVNPDNNKVCLINPSLKDNYIYGIENPIPENKKGKLENNNLYSSNCLINYQLKTAYNCCAINTTKNSFVNECALKYCIDNGARCLDFEIYSVDDRPIIGVSSKSGNTNMKESYNSLPLEEVLDVISERMAPDPLILHFRIKSDRIQLLESVKNALMNSKLSKKLVCYNKNYGHYWSYSHFENQAEQAKEPIRNIIKENVGKFNTSQNVIISFDLSETKWRYNTQNKTIRTISPDLDDLWKIVNIMTPHQIESISINKIKAMTGSEQGDLRAETKKKLFFVQPDPAVPHIDDLKRYGLYIGCQLVAAPLQFTNKKNVIDYNEFFKDSQHKLKPENLIQETIN